jgi:hypothetical protein
MIDARVLYALLASPSGLTAERAAVEGAINEWTALHSRNRKVVVLPTKWETDVTPAYGRPPQKIINEGIVDTCDLLIGFFGETLGTTTAEAASGTVSEILRVHGAGKPVLVYFGDRLTRANGLDLKQLEALRAFRDSCRGKALYGEFADADELARKVSKDLERLISSTHSAPEARRVEFVGNSPPPLRKASDEPGQRKAVQPKMVSGTTGPAPASLDERLRFGDSRLMEFVVDSALHCDDRHGRRDRLCDELKLAMKEDRVFPTKFFYATEEGARGWLELTRDLGYEFFGSSVVMLRSNAKEIALKIAEHFPTEMPDLVSLGSGDGLKDYYLVDNFHSELSANTAEPRINYFPIDYSYYLINETIGTFRERFKDRRGIYRIKPIVGDLLALDDFRYVYERFPNPDLFSILGNTIGNNDEDGLLKAICKALRPKGLALLEVNTNVQSLETQSKDFVVQKNNLIHNFSPLKALGHQFDPAKDAWKFSFEVSLGRSDCPGAKSIETFYQLEESKLTRVAINHRYEFSSFCRWASERLESDLIWAKEQNHVGLALFKRP